MYSFSFVSKMNIHNYLKKIVKKHYSYICVGFFTFIAQFSSVAQSSRILCDPMNHEAHEASLSITSSRRPPKPMSMELLMPSNQLILCHLLLSCPQSFPASGSNESAPPIRWPKYWSFSFNISPSNEHAGLIYFRMD